MQKKNDVEYRIVGGNEVVRYTLFEYVKTALQNKYNDLLRNYIEEHEKVRGYELVEDEIETCIEIGISVSRKGFDLNCFENEAISNVLQKMSERTRRILYLNIICGFSLTEIAMIENIAIQTTKDHFDRSIEHILLNEKSILKELRVRDDNRKND